MTWLQFAAAVILPVSFLLAAFVLLSLVTNGPLVGRSSNTLRFSKGPKAEVVAQGAVSLTQSGSGAAIGVVGGFFASTASTHFTSKDAEFLARIGTSVQIVFYTVAGAFIFSPGAS